MSNRWVIAALRESSHSPEATLMRVAARRMESLEDMADEAEIEREVHREQVEGLRAEIRKLKGELVLMREVVK